MNILLTAINAKYIHSNLAVYSLRACAGEYRDAVELAEYTINNQKDYILEELYKRKPDVLCFSCYIWNIDYVTDIAREYKKLSEYDDNFTKFVSMLPDYYNRLKEAGYESLGNELLDFAVEQGADSKNVYSLLANAFISMSKADRLAELIEKAKQLNSLSRDGIVSMLESLQADTATDR